MHPSAIGFTEEVVAQNDVAQARAPQTSQSRDGPALDAPATVKAPALYSPSVGPCRSTGVGEGKGATSRRSATTHNDLGFVLSVRCVSQAGLATVVLQQPPKRADEVHLVGMCVEVRVAGPLLVSERLELGADELSSNDAVPAGLEVTKRPLLVSPRDGDAVLADAPNPSRPRAEGAGQMGTRVPTLKVGRLIRFGLAEIRRWIEEQRRPPPGEA